MKESNKANTFQIVLSDTVVDTVKEVLTHRRGGNFNTLLSELVEQAANNMLYRYSRNKAKWGEAVVNRQLVQTLQKEIEGLKANKVEKGE